MTSLIDYPIEKRVLYYYKMAAIISYESVTKVSIVQHWYSFTRFYNGHWDVHYSCIAVCPLKLIVFLWSEECRKYKLKNCCNRYTVIKEIFFFKNEKKFICSLSTYPVFHYNKMLNPHVKLSTVKQSWRSIRKTSLSQWWLPTGIWRWGCLDPDSALVFGNICHFSFFVARSFSSSSVISKILRFPGK